MSKRIILIIALLLVCAGGIWLFVSSDDAGQDADRARYQSLLNTVKTVELASPLMEPHRRAIAKAVRSLYIESDGISEAGAPVDMQVQAALVQSVEQMLKDKRVTVKEYKAFIDYFRARRGDSDSREAKAFNAFYFSQD